MNNFNKMKIPFTLLLFCFACFGLKAQHDHFHSSHGIEIIIQTKDIKPSRLLKQDGITLDHGSTKEELHLYVKKEGYKYLKDNNIPFIIKEHVPAKITMKGVEEILKLKNKFNCQAALDFYPTYEAYELLMNEFQINYPDLCRIDTIYTWENERKLLIAKIGSNLIDDNLKPGFLYTSTMHGDELAGYPIMINLIDNLLCQYGNDDRITHLVDNINIYINPLANPNGAYTNDNSTVAGARRENGSFIDLNRNFPDPADGENPDGRSYQNETLAFMEFGDREKIDISCNIHGGVEVVNYPWDTFQERHADDDWWETIARNYADTAQFYSPNGYMEAYNNGITNGYDWYRVVGGRQDYMTYFKRGREFTLEISNRKELDSDQLPNVWNYNKNALLNYMEESLFGLRGIIRDCVSGLPIEAEVLIEGHDNLNSSVFSRAVSGSYFRYLYQGDYIISYLAEGYDTVTHLVTIVDKSPTVQDVEMCKEGTTSTKEDIASSLKITQQGNILWLDSDILSNDTKVEIYDMKGQRVLKQTLVDRSIKLSDNILQGIYYLSIQSDGNQAGKKLLIK